MFVRTFYISYNDHISLSTLVRKLFLKQSATINMNEKSLFLKQYIVKMETGVGEMHQETKRTYQKRDTTLSKDC